MVGSPQCRRIMAHGNWEYKRECAAQSSVERELPTLRLTNSSSCLASRIELAEISHEYKPVRAVWSRTFDGSDRHCIKLGCGKQCLVLLATSDLRILYGLK